MLTGIDFIDEIQQLRLELETKKEKAERRLATAQAEIDSIVQDLEALARTEARYREQHDLPAPDTSVDEALRQRLSGLTTKDMLIEMARKSGGMIRTAEVCRLLVKAGQFKDTRNAAGNIYSVIQRYPERFRKVRRGEYELVEDSGQGDNGHTQPGHVDMIRFTEPSATPPAWPSQRPPTSLHAAVAE